MLCLVCFYFCFVSFKKNNLIKLDSLDMIPKIIHYCWLSNDPIPSNIQHYMDSWKKYLPDYEFIHWNFDKFDKSSSRWVSEAF